MNKKSTLGERIKQIRALETQEEFGLRIGVTQRAVVNYETQGRIPKKTILRKICEQYAVDEHWLLTGEGEAKIPTVGDSNVSDEIQPLEIITSQNKKIPTVGESESLISVLRENAALLRQNGDLRVEVERQRARIADLERQLEAAQPAGMARLEQENRELRERVRELEQELDRIILHMPPPTDKAQQLLPSLRGEGKP